MSRALEDRLVHRLDARRRAGLERTMPLPERRTGVCYELAGRSVVGFCSNDYLGLASLQTAADLPPTTPAGSTASRLICGDSPEHRALEGRLARLVGCDDALLFASGFAASVGAIPALIEPDDRVFSDVHNHASLIDGLRLAKARAELLAHGMTPPPRPAGPGLTWWVCEAIYSMDGDRCPIDGIRSHLADGGLVYLDEAHALGLFPGGSGLARARGLRPTVVVGTLGKALGCAGAFVAGSATTCAWLRGIARSHVFSTGLSPLLVAAIDRAVTLVSGPEGDRRRARLWANVTRAGELLGRRLSSPIVPIHVGDNHLAVAVSDALLARGWHVQAIRPPTVPPGTARLRLSLSADHTVEQLTALVADLDDVLTTFGRRLRQAS